MKDFVFNSASIPLYEKSSAINKTDELFETLTYYIGNNPEPILYIDNDINNLLLASNYSLQDYQNEIITRNRELANFVLEYSDRFEQIDISEISQNSNINVGDDTRFGKNNSLKFACNTENILFTVSEESVWSRNIIPYETYGFKIIQYRGLSPDEYEISC